MKGLFLVLLLVVTLMSTAFAGFEGRNDDALVGVYSRINCGTGVECTGNTLGIFNIATTGGLESQIEATATTITESQCGSTFINSGAVIIQMELPEASTVPGCRLTFITQTATAFLINPDDDDQILITTNATGDRISNATLGNSITLQAIDGTNWGQAAMVGTWTDAN